MLNVAGPSFDFGNVLFAVLQECEHVRRGLTPDQAGERLLEAARRKLAQVRESYVEHGGTPGYWEELEREVLETSLPAYVPQAIEQTRLEKTGYDVWRRGDATARTLFALLGLVLGALLMVLPPYLIVERAFAFVLALGGLLYPELKQLVASYRHSRFLNGMIVEAEKYQKNSRIHYLSEARLQKELDAMGEVGRPVEEEREPPRRPRGRERDAP